MCQHGAYGTDKTIRSTCNIDQQKFFFGSTLPNLIIDVAILFLPIWQVSQLRLDVLPKIGLCVAFAFWYTVSYSTFYGVGVVEYLPQQLMFSQPMLVLPSACALHL